ncbi:molybdate ABC transporter permease subunit [Leptospira jelokensis]|uniref:Molybdenum transport system permease n=1 Tax=Leptospira jelokensis TaxID=2484931 RepID=A0A4Z1A411_9LEPT|nr:molybdate ABC transporter permease subunit [Leptospira jelokensis]TGL75672.1 molybdate ABC transporter permease subunit [Leptospira jelokensis]TGM05094.1 molybdate ABC transporter permease subunit [Leptospira jelokensis]
MIDTVPIWLTLQLAVLTTLILVFLTIPIAYGLTYAKFRFRTLLETVLNLPLVLPPTVIGFYLLILFSPKYLFGEWLEGIFQIRLAFRFSGILIGSIVFNLPFMLQSIQVGFLSVPKAMIETGMALGKSKWTILTRIILPNCKFSIFTGMVLCFTHTIGEFGVVLLIGGSIPGKTKVASIAIFEEVEAMNYANAHLYSFILLCISFFSLFLLFLWKRNGLLFSLDRSS